jgi:hypothetical protein
MERRTIPFGKPIIGHEEQDAVAAVLAGTTLVHGPRVEEFEEQFAAFVGAKHAIAVGSCTAGLHLVYLAAGIGAGHEVIVPAQTHVATAFAVEYVGATPVFVDAELRTGNIDLDAVEAAITSRTRALSLVLALAFAGALTVGADVVDLAPPAAALRSGAPAGAGCSPAGRALVRDGVVHGGCLLLRAITDSGQIREVCASPEDLAPYVAPLVDELLAERLDARERGAQVAFALPAAAERSGPVGAILRCAGEDALAEPGTNVKAIGDGQVVYAALHPGSRRRGNWGNIVILGHTHVTDGKPFFSVYGHLGDVLVAPGQLVRCRDCLGHIGAGRTPENGYWPEPHLHFGIYRGPWEGKVLPGYFKEEDGRTKLEYWVAPSEFVRTYYGQQATGNRQQKLQS